MTQERIKHDEEGFTGEGNFYFSLSAVLLVFVLEFRGRNSYKEGRM